MAIGRTGARLTIVEQLSRRLEFRNRPLALEVRDQVSGRLLRASESLVKGIGGVIASAASRFLAIIKPEMVTSAKLSFNIMEKPVTVEMFRQFVEDSKYSIVGHNANELISLLAGPTKSDHVLTHVSYDDSTAFVAWRKEKTGQDLRIPTEQEWKDAKNAVGNQLTGNLWEWTQTIYSGVTRVLRSLFNDIQNRNRPENRYNYDTVRLVEDKK